MIHCGDITKINGAKVPVVDTMIFGAPCQDLSVAGKRAGMKHGDLGDEETTRSGLFMEAVRIIKEMRERDKRNGRTGVDIRPRYGVYENVPGAFSSNKGEDFRIVLEELVKVADKNAVVPRPADGKWTNCGCIMGDGWSIAWRVFDAQFWGVPQRRRRIALVADFGGQSAPEILFVREGLPRHSQPSRAQGQRAAAHAEGSPVADHRAGSENVAYTMQDREGCAGGGKGALIQTDRSAALRCQNAQVLFQPVTFSKCHRAQSNTDYESWQESDTANTLNAFDTGDVRTTEVVVGLDAYNQSLTGDKAKTLGSIATDTDHIPSVVYALDRASFNQGKNAKFDFEVTDDGVNSPLVAKGPGAVCYGIGNGQVNGTGLHDKIESLNCMHDPQAVLIAEGINGDKAGTLDSSYYKGCGMRQGVEREVVAVPQKMRYIVRRLTPLECERLQGFPDGWTQIGEVVGYERQIDERTGEEYVQAIYEYIDDSGKKRKTSDAARYKALGNSISLPNWKWVLKRLCACYERDATMASLFDGIGGFPYLWEQLNGKGSCLWASEIEDFPIAVTKARIGE